MGRLVNIKGDPVRERILQILEERPDIDMKTLSLRIGKSHSYIQQFLNRGVPYKLPEDVRRDLATALNISERELGGPVPRETLPIAASTLSRIKSVAEYNVLTAAGGGIVLENEERVRDWPFPRDFLEAELQIAGGQLAVVSVKGDSMEPTLRAGDKILINLDDKNVSQPGLFVLWDGDGRVVKRVERVLGAKHPTLKLISDNPMHSTYEVLADLVHIAGRAICAIRRL